MRKIIVCDDVELERQPDTELSLELNHLSEVILR